MPLHRATFTAPGPELNPLGIRVRPQRYAVKWDAPIDADTEPRWIAAREFRLVMLDYLPLNG